MNSGMMNKLKAQLKTAPSTHDEDYDLKKQSLKDLGNAVRSYKSSMEKILSATKTLVESLVNIQKSLNGITDDSETPEDVRDVALAYTASTNRISSDFFVEYKQRMDASVLSAVEQIKREHHECSKLEKERNRIMNEYDVYRNIVAKKEAEYQKKSKDLAQSKSYSSDVAKRDELYAKFEEADRVFKDSHTYLMQSKVATTSTCLKDFMTCSYNFAEGLAREFEGLASAATRSAETFQAANAVRQEVSLSGA